MKTKILILLFRWSARILGTGISLVFLFFFSAALFGSNPADGFPQPMATRDILILSLTFISIFGLLLAWKKELVGGLIAFLAYSLNMVLHHNVIPLYVFALTGLLYVLAAVLQSKTQKPATS